MSDRDVRQKFYTAIPNFFFKFSHSFMLMHIGTCSKLRLVLLEKRRTETYMQIVGVKREALVFFSHLCSVHYIFTSRSVLSCKKQFVQETSKTQEHVMKKKISFRVTSIIYLNI